MSRRPSMLDTSKTWMGSEYIVNGKVVGRVSLVPDEHGDYTWSADRGNSNGKSYTLDRAKAWVEHYEKMGGVS